MATLLDSRQVVNRSALSALGNTANLGTDTIFTNINTYFASASALATASVLMLRDANKNTQLNNLIESATSIATAAGTTTLTVASAFFQQFTGSTTQTVVMPDATTLVVGQSWLIVNRSTGNVTVNANGGGLLKVLTPNAQATFVVTNIGTSAGVWDVSFSTSGAVPFIQTLVTTDATTTGSNTTLLAGDISFGVVRLTNASLVSFSGIPAGTSGQQIIVENQTGNQITVNNQETTASAANRIYTGTGSNVQMAANASFQMVYDTTISSWMIVGGTGSGSGSGSGKNYLSALTTSNGINNGNGNFELASTAGWSLFNTTFSYSNTQTVTISNASPAVFTTSANHNLSVGQSVFFTTTGTLPTGLTANTTYYVSLVPSATTYQVSATLGGTSLNTSSAGSGTHTYFSNGQLQTLAGSPINSGAANITTFNTVSSGQLAGSYSLQTAASASLPVGQGFISTAFNIDTADQAKRLAFKLYYKVVSGSPVLASTVSNTFSVWIYDVTNSVWIQPTGSFGMNQNSGTGYLSGDFQTSLNGTSYRIAVVCQNTLSSAVTMYWDDFQVGPQTISYGVPATDWTAFTPTGTWTTNTTYTGFYRRIGDTAEIQYYLSLAGAPNAASLVLNMPSGLSINSAKMAPSNSNIQTVGIGSGQRNGAFIYQIYALYGTSSTINVNYSLISGAGVNAAIGPSLAQTATVPFTVGSGDYISVTVRVPITGWSANVQMSSDTDTRVVAFQGANVASSSVGTSATQIPFTSVSDTHGSWSTNTYTVPVTGYYRITAGLVTSSVTLTTGNAFTMTLFINGAAYKQIGAVLGNGLANGYAVYGSIEVLATAGTTLALFAASSVATTLNSSPNTNYLDISRISGPSAIMSTETIAASYYLSANQAVSSGQAINYDTKEFDTHSAVTTGSGWKFTAPAAGIYQVGGVNGLVSAASGYFIYKNGTLYKHVAYSSTTARANPSTLIQLNAGEYIDLRLNSAATVQGGTLSTDGAGNINIRRI